MDREPEDNSRTDWSDAWRDLAGASVGLGTTWRSLVDAMFSALADSAAPGDVAATVGDTAAAWQKAARQALPTEHAVIQGLRSLTGIRHLVTPWFDLLPWQEQQAQWPHLGPLQHETAALEALQTAAADYRNALLAYLDQLDVIVDRSLAEFDARLSRRPDLDRENPHAMFDLWSEIAERCYEEQLATDEYARAIAGVANRWAALRLQLQALVDPCLEALGLPSRRAVEETQLALDRLERRHRGEIAAVSKEIAALRRSLDDGKPGLGGGDRGR